MSFKGPAFWEKLTSRMKWSAAVGENGSISRHACYQAAAAQWETSSASFNCRGVSILTVSMALFAHWLQGGKGRQINKIKLSAW